MNDLVSLFCAVDDFWNNFKPYFEKNQIGNKSTRGPTCKFSMSEIMTILILFHQSNYRTFKHFYNFSLRFYKKDFPNLPSYSRFVSLQKTAFIPLFAYLHEKKDKLLVFHLLILQ